MLNLLFTSSIEVYMRERPSVYSGNATDERIILNLVIVVFSFSITLEIALFEFIWFCILKQLCEYILIA